MTDYNEQGFDNFLRKDEVDLSDEFTLVEANQIFTDLSVVNDKIEGVGVNKLIAGTIESQSIVMDVLDDAGDVEIRAGIASGDFDNTGANSGFIIGVDDSDGNTPKFYFGSGESNSISWDGVTLLVNGSSVANEAWYGDGSDGDVTINSGSFSSGPITNNALTRDAFFDNLTVENTRSLNTAGFRLFCRSSITNNGTIHFNGNAGGAGGNASGQTGGTAGTAGAALSDGYLSGAVAGKAGGAGASAGTQADGTNGNAGTAGNNQASAALGSNGVAGGNSGDGGDTNGAPNRLGGDGQSGGSGGTSTAADTEPRSAVWGVLMLDFNDPTSIKKYTSSASGGSGAGGASGAEQNSGATGGAGGGGGGSGSAGGVMVVSSRIITNTGTISALGGNGGNGGNGSNAVASGGNPAGGGGGGGGGAPGNGGVLLMIYNKLTDSGTISVAAGTSGTAGTVGTGVDGGSNGTAGTAGATGVSGVLIKLAQ